MGLNLEKGNSQQPEYKLEVVDLADAPALLGNRGKSSRHPVALDLSDDDAVEAALLAEEATLPDSLNPKFETSRVVNGRISRPTRIAKPASGRVNRDKPIFTSSVAAEILNLHPRTLRIYEELGLVMPFRTETQRRRYSQNDIKKTRFIQFLTQNRRVNLEGVKIILYMLDELRQSGIPDPVRHIFQDYRELD
jgi:MerR family transcriptional regulator/heat shock protein HspR